MLAERLRKLTSFMKATPLHPQWLLTRGHSSSGLMNLASGRVLDIGCADRGLEAELPMECRYVGLDYPETGAKLYKARPDVFADAAGIPFAPESFETVVMFEVLEHLAHPQQSLREVARVLKPDGKLLMTVPFLYPMHDEPYDFQRYTRYGLGRELVECGLLVERIEPTLGSAESAGLLVNLALAGMMLRAIERRSPSMIVTPVILIVIPLVNALSVLIGWILPTWPALTSGYQVVACKQ